MKHKTACKQKCILFLYLFLMPHILWAQGPNDKTNIVTPTAGQVAWQDCEIGVIFHLDAPILVGDFKANNGTKNLIDPKDYDPYKLDTDQWLSIAKDMGAKYAVFTATHFNGFMQWQSDLYPYGLKQASWRDGKGDIVDDFVKSCHKYGIKPGIYFSTAKNAYNEVWGHYVDWGKGKGTPQQQVYNRIAEKQTEELCSRYGDLIQIWYDGGTLTPAQGGSDTYPIFKKYQPDSVYYHDGEHNDHRWIGNEDGYAEYPCWATMGPMQIMPGQKGSVAPSWKPIRGTGDPNGSLWSPGMVDIPLRKSGGRWFWNPNKEHTITALDELVSMYYTSVGRNCNLVIGLGVNDKGLIPKADAKRCQEFGQAIKKIFKNKLATTSGRGNKIELTLPAGASFDHVVIQEEIKYGERVRKFKLEYFSNGKWTELNTGSCIGHKRIIKTKPITAEKLLLTITESICEPIIKNLAVYKSQGVVNESH